MKMDEVKYDRLTKDYEVNFDYNKLPLIGNNLVVDEFVNMDVPVRLRTRVLTESFFDDYVSLDEHIANIDPLNPFSEYLKYGIEAVRGRFDSVVKMYSVFGGNHPLTDDRDGVATHMHFRRPESALCRTVTAVIPLNIREPITEAFVFQWTDEPMPVLENGAWDKVGDKQIRREYTKAFIKGMRAAKKYPVNRIELPPQNEILILDFNSYNYLHAVHPFTTNNHLHIVFDDCK